MRLALGDLPLVETGRRRGSTKDCLLVLSRIPRDLLRILGEFPLQQGLLLSVAELEPSVLTARYLSLLGLEVLPWQVLPGSQFILPGLVRFGPHIGEVIINEDTVIAGRYFTFGFGPGPPELSWQPWETSPAPFPSMALVQGCGCRVAGARAVAGAGV